MSRFNVAIHNDIQLLMLLRDEIQLQAHLLKADLKSRWEELEDKRDELTEHIQRAEVAAGDARAKAEKAASQLVDALRTGYTQVRDALGA